MGVQMYIVAAIWVAARYLFRTNFNLPIAVAVVWISNPITVVPLYYGFLVTGNLFLGGGDLGVRVGAAARSHQSADGFNELFVLPFLVRGTRSYTA